MVKVKPVPDYERLVREHHAAVYQSAWRILRHEEDARDIAQEVFLDVLGEPARFAAAEEPARVLRWLAARKALARLRGERNRRGREEDRRMGSQQERGDEVVAQAEVREIVARELSGLADELRCALVLRYDEGMSFAAMGETLGVSGPTARERVERGLEKLRVRLGRTGCAAFLPRLPELLSSEAAVSPPAGLEAGLLALGSGAAKSVGLGVGLGLAGVVLAGIALATAILPERESASDGIERSPAVVALAPDASEAGEPELLSLESGRVSAAEEVARGSLDATPSTGDAQAPPTGRVVGRLLDADRRPRADVLVFARSVARDGKLSRYVAEGASDALGRFALDLPVEREEGQRYHLFTRHELFVAHRSGELLVGLDEPLELGDIELMRKSDDVPGAWSADLYVVDEEGAPVSGAVVAVERRLLIEEHPWSAEVEARGRTDAAGHLRASGEWLGEKRARIQAESQGFRAATIEFALTRRGHDAFTFVLERGFSVTGRVRAFDDGGVPDQLQVHAVGRDKSRWIHARVLADGRFELSGLDVEDDYELFLGALGFSPARRLGLLPDAGELLFELKRFDDARDVGDHMAELHGRVVEGSTGLPVPVDEFGVDEIWVAPEDRDRPAEWLLAHYRIGSMAQRMAQGEAREPESDFHKIGLRPAIYVVRAQAPGYAPAMAGPFVLEEGQLERDVVLTLRPGATLAGHVRDSSGERVPGAFVWLGADSLDAGTRLTGLDQTLLREDPRWLPRCAKTDATGAFRFEHLPPDLPYRLGVLHHDHEASLGERLELGEGEQRADLRLPAGPRR